MKRLLISFLLACTLFPSFVAYVNGQQEIRKRQEELDKLRDEIQRIELGIKVQQKNEKATLELLDSYDRKSTLVRSLISRLYQAEQKLQTGIDSTKAELASLEEQLRHLKKHYADYVTSVYKAGSVHELELLLTSASVNQALIRAEYLKRFTEQRKRDAERIGLKRREIENLEARLQEELTEQRRLIAEKNLEEDRLASLITDRRDALQQIRKDKRSLQREIERKVKAAKELESVITSLIEAERIAREKKVAEGILPVPPVSAGVFESRKGKLRWPVREGSVVARFGNQTHPTLRTVTQNPGIDISVRPGSQIVAVADGRVARIWWLVSYGNLIILDHGGGYRTIYAHLADMQVTEGQEVNEGEAIATSGETVDGARMHFELWKDRDKQNPEHWLARK